MGARFVAGGGVLELSYTFEVVFSCAGLGLRVAICGFCAFALSLLRVMGWVFLLLKASDVFWVHVLLLVLAFGSVSFALACTGFGLRVAGCRFCAFALLVLRVAGGVRCS